MNEHTFDAVKARDNLVAAIRSLAKEQGFSRVVIGISGGKDSTVAAALCARALGPDNVLGILMPDRQQREDDFQDSLRVCESLYIPYRIVSISQMHKDLLSAVALVAGGPFNADLFQNLLDQESKIYYNKTADINVGPRLRMTVLRYITQSIGARLVGTGNLSESTVGYCTKDGDTSCDFSLLGKLTSKEVVEIGLTMEELPQDLVLKTPSDGLCGISDEEKLGVSYEAIHNYIRHPIDVNDPVNQKIAKLEAASRHKRAMPLILEPFI